jgi:hypothetical protein
LVPLGVVLELGAVGWVGVLFKEPALDFVLYYWRARYAVQLGWAHVYSASREPLVWAHLPPNGHVVNNDPLPLLWLVTPLALIPVWAAIAVWEAATIASLMAAVRLIAPKGRFGWWLVACFGFWPVTWSLMLGQVVPIVCLTLAGVYVLLRSGRQSAAGLLLVAIAVKPQLALLVPFALLLAGYRRAFAVWAAGSVLLLIACVAVIGPAGVSEYARNLGEGLRSPATFHIDPHSMLTGFIGTGAAGRLAEILVAGGALYAAFRWRGAGPEIAIASGTVGSLLATPFLHTQDLTVLFVGLGIYLAAQRHGRRLGAFAYAGLFAPLLPVVPLLFEVAWLGLLIYRRPAQAQGAAPVVSSPRLSAPARLAAEQGVAPALRTPNLDG